MSAYVIKLPDVGEGIAEAEIVAWHVGVGDTIGEDDPIVEVMTDKATVELPSPVAGTITRLGAEIGDLVPVGTEIIWIEVDADGSAPSEHPATNGQEDELASEDHLAPDMQPDGASEREVAVAPAPADAPAPGSSGGSVHASSPDPRPGPSPTARQAPVQTRVAPTRPAGERNGHVLASPAVRRRALALRIDLAGVAGSGPGGRIEHGDLDNLLTSSTSHVNMVVHATVAGDSAASSDAVQSVKIVGLRRNIAQRMKVAKDRIPHFTYVDEIDMTELERLRAQLNAEHADARPKLTVMPFLMRAVIVAVKDFPQMNARFDDEAGTVQRYSAVHLGVAAQTPKGLMVPVLHHAEAHDLWSSAAEVARLAAGARDGTIKLAELSGSTITISSLGAIGGIVSTPIINYPEVAIVGVNKMAIRPVWIDGQWVPRQMMNLSSSFDHRVVDGSDAAQFIQRLKALLETPALLFL